MLRTTMALLLSGALAVGLATPGLAGSAGTEQDPFVDFELVETWEMLSQLESSPGASLSRLMVQSPSGDLFIVSEISGPGDEETGSSASDGVVRSSSTGQVVGSWDYDVLLPYDPLRATWAVGADVDADGNLVLALVNTFHELDEDGFIVRTGSSGQIATFSPTGEILMTVDLAAGQFPEGLTHVDGVTYVLCPTSGSTATQVVGYDGAGALVSEFDLDGVRPVNPYGSFAHTSDGRLVMLADGAGDEFGYDTTAVVFSREGQVLDRWAARMPTEWTQEEIEGTATGYINDQPLAEGIAVGPADDVVLTNQGLAVEVLTIDGAHKQTIILPPSTVLNSLKSRTLGLDGRLYVSSLPFEIFVYARPAEVLPEAWTATACVAFTGQVTGPQDEPALTFEVSEGVLPEGITLDAATGVVSGTSTAVGEHRVTVSVRAAGTEVAAQAVVLTIEPGEATSVTVPVITGDALVGSTLTATATAQPAGDLTYQWLRDGTAIPDATHPSYTLSPDDEGAQVAVLAATTTGCRAVAQSPALTIAAPGQPSTEETPEQPSAVETPESLSSAPEPGRTELSTTGFAGSGMVIGGALLALVGVGLVLGRRALLAR